MTRWAYLGPAGTFTEQAARTLQEHRAADADRGELIPSPDVPAAIAAVRSGDADAACVPMESSVEGSVPLTQDALTAGPDLVIVDEAFVPVTFDLLVRPGTERSAIRKVGAHPHGLAQVREWLAAELPAAEPTVYSSNGAAAAAVAAGELDAAAAAPVAATQYGLQTVVHDIGAVRDAVTRFVLVARPGSMPAPTGDDRTSLVLGVANRPGSLLAALTEFAARGINLTRLESRPTRHRMGEYVFLLDADGHIADPAMADVLGALVRHDVLVRFLGSYPRRDGLPSRVSDFATVARYEAAAAQVARWRDGRSDGDGPAGPAGRPDAGPPRWQDAVRGPGTTDRPVTEDRS